MPECPNFGSFIYMLLTDFRVTRAGAARGRSVAHLQIERWSLIYQRLSFAGWNRTGQVSLESRAFVR
jgi:hypothetical protein